jgi:formylglycine-generating enzyme required for sulfatase activity
MIFLAEKRNNFKKLKYFILGLLCLFFCMQCHKFKEDSDFIRIRGGLYIIGSPRTELGYDKKGNQERIRLVKVKKFYMAKYEVTQKQYEEIMGEHDSSFSGDNFPVDKVTWYEAVDFCNRLSEKEGLQPVYTIFKDIIDPNSRDYYDKYKYLVEWNKDANGYRLPTSNEWEIACRAGSRTIYNTGNSINQDQANFTVFSKEDINRHILPIGSYAPNAWGLYDMHGNVREWCWDTLDNRGRIFRGGAWSSSIYGIRSGRVAINAASNKIGGIRLVRNAN